MGRSQSVLVALCASALTLGCGIDARTLDTFQPDVGAPEPDANDAGTYVAAATPPPKANDVDSGAPVMAGPMVSDQPSPAVSAPPPIPQVQSAAPSAPAAMPQDDVPIRTEHARIRFGEATLEYSCQYRQLRFPPGVDSLGQFGTGFEGSYPNSQTVPYPLCEDGPAARPSIIAYIWFRGFLPSEGIPNAEYDLSDPRMVDRVSVSFGFETPGELPAGTMRPYAQYRSYSPLVQPDGSLVDQQLPGLSGRLVVSAVAGDPNPILRQIVLTDVALPQTTSVGSNDFPESVTIEEAVMFTDAF